ncbi:MAG: ABC transporter permease [Anaerolineae bacterium]|nr:ABC transporter permease [Anaerolineae bacterium]
MGRYLFRRAVEAIPLLFIISFVLFWMLNQLGDPLAYLAETRQKPTAAKREQLIRKMGLDKPFYVQYLVWLVGNDWMQVDVYGDGTLYEPGPRKGVLRGDFGNSFITRGPAIDRIWKEGRLPNTLVLMIPYFIITVALALGIGLYSALRQYSFFDNLTTGLSFIFFSMPIFFIGMMSIYIFGLQFKVWGWPSLPIGGMFEPGQPRTLINLVEHMIMPTFCLVAITLAGYVRFIRSSMLEVMGQDYIRTAKAKGLRDGTITRRHALKNAALPLITLIGLDIPFLLAGAVVTERLFAWPGMGRLFVESLEKTDINVIMLILMLLCVAVVACQLLTDMVYTWFDPRIRYN